MQAQDEDRLREDNGAEGSGRAMVEVLAHKHCNCKKSRCLKLYCECFATGATIFCKLIQAACNSRFFLCCQNCMLNSISHMCGTLHTNLCRNCALALQACSVRAAANAATA